jgi:hypothetical protein
MGKFRHGLSLAGGSSVGTFACALEIAVRLTPPQPGVATRYKMPLREVTAGENEDRFSTLEPAAVGGNIEEAVAFGCGSQVAGALPT